MVVVLVECGLEMVVDAIALKRLLDTRAQIQELPLLLVRQLLMINVGNGEVVVDARFGAHIVLDPLADCVDQGGLARVFAAY